MKTIYPKPEFNMKNVMSVTIGNRKPRVFGVFYNGCLLRGLMKKYERMTQFRPYSKKQAIFHTRNGAEEFVRYFDNFCDEDQNIIPKDQLEIKEFMEA